MNKVILTSVNLGRDPEIKYSGDTTIARFSVASKRRGQKDITDWINIVAFNKTAEFCEKYFHKGSRINLIGRIQSGSYTNKGGQTVYTTDVVAEEVEFGESKNAQGNPDSKPAEKPVEEPADFENVPDDLDSELPFN